MTRKQRRGIFILASLAVLGLAAALVLNALQESIVFFYSPTDVREKNIKSEQRFRLGGLVEQGSVSRAGTKVGFTITDTKNSIKVSYQGILPDLFREGQGVVTEGSLNGEGVFIAGNVLAKHDETYMPPEVAKALKKQGVWRPETGQRKN